MSIPILDRINNFFAKLYSYLGSYLLTGKKLAKSKNYNNISCFPYWLKKITETCVKIFLTEQIATKNLNAKYFLKIS